MSARFMQTFLNVQSHRGGLAQAISCVCLMLEAAYGEWAAAGLKDTLLRCEVKPEVVYGNEKAVQPRVQA